MHGSCSVLPKACQASSLFTRSARGGGSPTDLEPRRAILRWRGGMTLPLGVVMLGGTKGGVRMGIGELAAGRGRGG